MNGLRVDRICEVKEIENCLREFDAVFPHLTERISSYEAYAMKLYQYANVYVCKSGMETCGLLVFYSNDMLNETAYISLIGVHEAYRGKRVGSFLLDWCKSFSKRMGMKKLKLEVDFDNEQAIAFYLRKGFSKCEKEDTRSSMYLRMDL